MTTTPIKNPILACLILYLPFLLIDLFSCGLDIRRIRKGSGPSGFPAVTLVLYICILIFGIPSLAFLTKLIGICLVAAIHQIVTFLVPHLYESRRKKVKSG